MRSRDRDWRTSLDVWQALDPLLHAVQHAPTLDLRAGHPGKCQPPAEDNWRRKVRYLTKVGAIPSDVGVHMLDVSHDSWCGIHRGRRCNCNPDIRVKASVSAARRN
jgi:hypothetical protein